MVGPVFGGIGGRLNRQATPVASVADIQRAITKALHDDRPCVLEMSSNIPMTSGVTIPGGLRAFALDGLQRFKLVPSQSMPFLFHAAGAADDNAGPVIISNTTVKVKAGTQLSCVALVEQLPLSAYTIKTTSVTLQDVHIDALDGATQRCTSLLALPATAGFRFGVARLERVTTRGVLSLVDAGDSSALWILTANVLGLGGDGDPGSLIGQGSGTASFIGSVFSQVSGEYAVNTGEFSTGNVWQSLTSTLTGATFTTNAAGSSQKQTLCRVDLGRALSVGDVDLDAISPSTITDVTLNSAAPTLTPGKAAYMRVTHGASASGIVTVSGTGAIDGRPVVLRFVSVAGTAVYTDNSGNLRLTANFTPTADDTLTIAYDSTTGLWYEVARSVN